MECPKTESFNAPPAAGSSPCCSPRLPPSPVSPGRTGDIARPGCPATLQPARPRRSAIVPPAHLSPAGDNHTRLVQAKDTPHYYHGPHTPTVPQTAPPVSPQTPHKHPRFLYVTNQPPVRDRCYSV